MAKHKGGRVETTNAGDMKRSADMYGNKFISNSQSFCSNNKFCQNFSFCEFSLNSALFSFCITTTSALKNRLRLSSCKSRKCCMTQSYEKYDIFLSLYTVHDTIDHERAERRQFTLDEKTYLLTCKRNIIWMNSPNERDWW